MIFNKPINDITFEDVARFCEKRVPEGKQLDYKYLLPKNNERFAKTIASFANALGGTIIIGVKDDSNDMPAPPFTGIPLQHKIRNKIEDIIQTYIDPVVFVEINVCHNEHGHMFVVINIPQSNLTPHLVGKFKRAYIRTGQSSRPEVIVHPDKLPWLLNNRRKSEKLKHILLDKAEAHFNNFLKPEGLKPEQEKGLFSLSLCPLYPEDALIEYPRLRGIMQEMFPSAALQTVQDGIVKKDYTPFKSILEINSYGLVFQKTALAPENEKSAVALEDIKRNMETFFDTAVKFHSKLLFGGPLNMRISFSGMRGLRASFEGQQTKALEDYMRVDRIYAISDIEADRGKYINTLLNLTAWSLGLEAEF
jgi:hypothetical protein